jgi:long-chain acyl-CoA synthetase
MALERSPLVEQIFVYGNSLESVLVAAVVPKKRALIEWAKASGIGGTEGDGPTLEAVCADPKTKAHVLSELNGTARAAGLLGFEIPKAVVLEAGGFWSPEADLVTPTLKKKRPALQKKYQADLDGMYAALRAAENAKRQQQAAPAAEKKPAPAAPAAA